MAKKISKSKGNGLSIEEWLRYGSRIFGLIYVPDIKSVQKGCISILQKRLMNILLVNVNYQIRASADT